MKAIYITTDEARADSLKRQLAELSPSTDLDTRARAADARALLASGVVDAVLTDTQLSDEDALDLLADIRRYTLPLVVIVTAARGVSAGSHGALYAHADDYVWFSAAGTSPSLSRRSFASDVSVAIRRAVERRRGDDSAGERPLRTAYIGSDEQVRAALESAPGVRMTPADGSGSDVVVIEASPYDAIPLVHTLRESAPTVPVVLLCRTDIRDPDDVATMLGIDRVLVKSGDWLAQLLPLLRAVTRTGRPGAQDLHEPAMPAHGRLPHLEAPVGLDAVGPPSANSGDRVCSDVGTPVGDLQPSVLEDTQECGGRSQALTTQQQQELAAERARCEELERQLNEARAREARLASTLEAGRAESRAPEHAVAVEHEQELARRRAEFEEVGRWLKDAQDELRRRSSLVQLIRAQSRIARRNTRLAELAVGVVTELDSLISQMTESAERAAEASPSDTQLDRGDVVTELDSLIREMTESAERAAKSSLLDAQLTRARRTAARARDIARHFLLFSRWQAQPPEPTDLGTALREFEPTLGQLVGSSNELLVRTEPTTALVSLGYEQIGRLLVSMAILCRDALPIGGQVVFETENVETVPFWNPSLSHAEPLPFVRLSVTVRGHTPQPIHVTPALDVLVQECDGHCEEVPIDEPSTGFCIYLPRGASGE